MGVKASAGLVLGVLLLVFGMYSTSATFEFAGEINYCDAHPLVEYGVVVPCPTNNWAPTYGLLGLTIGGGLLLSLASAYYLGREASPGRREVKGP